MCNQMSMIHGSVSDRLTDKPSYSDVGMHVKMLCKVCTAICSAPACSAHARTKSDVAFHDFFDWSITTPHDFNDAKAFPEEISRI